MEIKGTVRNGVVVVEGADPLPEGTKVVLSRSPVDAQGCTLADWDSLQQAVQETGARVIDHEQIVQYLSKLQDATAIVAANILRATRNEFGKNAEIRLELYDEQLGKMSGYISVTTDYRPATAHAV